ncbi:hypothetical protein HME9304_01746 [Flagellimonas maritima]|uniref:Uncharacterized protein n=1 Tax=Flagellimonas maritima TaxID=1383885 RepID=A0A2Z4LSD9_9FLAO|nr:hypothetical protein [Allomuricauda aurantiaca]AWX44743.1 hypothetical protein HME9304_01746 [Allomuricauda aurantiaca]
MDRRDKYERKVEKYVTKGFKIFFMILLGIIFIFLMGYAFMLLWNWLMPELFGLVVISYWQAIGLLVLAKILFGFGDKSPKGRGSKNKHQNKLKRFCDSKKEYSQWQHYDQFWKEEGEQAYKEYLQRNQKTDQ